MDDENLIEPVDRPDEGNHRAVGRDDAGFGAGWRVRGSGEGFHVPRIRINEANRAIDDGTEMPAVRMPSEGGVDSLLPSPLAGEGPGVRGEAFPPHP